MIKNEERKYLDFLLFFFKNKVINVVSQNGLIYVRIKFY